mmetsp:Transcript_67836/g.172199  ORF Transcript_67836/g.172199 Transcript_67836/m.172199 type:complete len:406 (-) Transcript_67836:1136-2353(-)
MNMQSAHRKNISRQTAAHVLEHRHLASSRRAHHVEDAGDRRRSHRYAQVVRPEQLRLRHGHHGGRRRRAHRSAPDAPRAWREGGQRVRRHRHVGEAGHPLPCVLHRSKWHHGGCRRHRRGRQRHRSRAAHRRLRRRRPRGQRPSRGREPGGRGHRRGHRRRGVAQRRRQPHGPDRQRGRWPRCGRPPDEGRRHQCLRGPCARHRRRRHRRRRGGGLRHRRHRREEHPQRRRRQRGRRGQVQAPRSQGGRRRSPLHGLLPLLSADEAIVVLVDGCEECLGGRRREQGLHFRPARDLRQRDRLRCGVVVDSRRQRGQTEGEFHVALVRAGLRQRGTAAAQRLPPILVQLLLCLRAVVVVDLVADEHRQAHEQRRGGAGADDQKRALTQEALVLARGRLCRMRWSNHC